MNSLTKIKLKRNFNILAKKAKAKRTSESKKRLKGQS